MIRAFLIFNTTGKPRVLKFYENKPIEKQMEILKQMFNILSHRNERMSNFVDLGKDFDDARLIYKHFATLYFAVIADSSESELGILDLIHSFVETLDKCFKNVCELDIVFHYEEVHRLLDEMIVGGLVAETKTSEILEGYNQQRQIELAEKPLEAKAEQFKKMVENRFKK